MNLKVAIYTRVSTQDQSVAAQVMELRGYAQRQDWTVIGEFTDVMSGSKAVRPGLESLLASEPRPEAILVVKLDRLGRSLLNVSMLIKKLDDMGVALICSSQGIDTRKDNPCGRFQLNMLSAVAEFERSLIRERTCAGLAVARAKGKVLGRPSTLLPDEMARMALIGQWSALGKRGGFRGLAAMLGGVSPMTARKLYLTAPLKPTPVEQEVW